MTEIAGNPVAAHLHPEEKVIWAGRPQGARSPGAAAVKPWGLPRGLVTIIVLLAAVFLAGKSLWPQLTSTLPEELSELPIGPVVIAVFIVLALPILVKRFKIDDASRLKRHFDSMGFAITDRRLLIVEGKQVISLGPADLGKLRVRDAGDGLEDVLLLKRSRDTVGGSMRRDVIGRELKYTGFKRIKDAAAIQARIEEWAAGQVEQAEARAAAFNRGDQEARRSIENGRLGLACITPSNWQMEVRNKARPFGSTFVDRENWQAPGGSQDWNVLRLRGPLGATIEFEVFETEPKATLEEMTGKLANLTKGEPVAMDKNVAYGDLEGFSVTRRRDTVPDPVYGQLADVARMPFLLREFLLHDGRHQVFVTAAWPEDCPQTARAIETVLESISIRRG